MPPPPCRIPHRQTADHTHIRECLEYIQMGLQPARVKEDVIITIGNIVTLVQR